MTTPNPDAPLVDVSTLTQQQAHDYLQDLTAAFIFPGSEWDVGWDTESADRAAYIAKIKEVKAYLATFPVPLN